jgi:O-antigen ligase
MWCALTIIYSLDPAISFARLLSDVLLFVALANTCFELNNKDDVQRLFGHFLLGCGLLQALNIVAWSTFPSSLTYSPDQQGLVRFSGFSNDPNVLGSLMLATVGAGVAHWSSSAGRRKIMLASVMLTGIVFAVLADSRSEVAVTVLGCFAYMIWKHPLKGIFVAIVVVFVFIIGYQRMGENVQLYFNRDVSTLTGRTEAWKFEVEQLRQRPLLGYGYEVEGAIFQSRYFQDWFKTWDEGPNTPLHNSYLTIMIGVGIPAFLYWLFIVLSPWVELFRDVEDPWNLKPLFFLVVVPMLVLGLDESGLSEPRYVRGLLFFMCWLLAERYSVFKRAAQKENTTQTSTAPPVVAALTAFR